MGEADYVESALEKISNLDLDVIFLDIQLADESGIEIAAFVNKLDHPPLIVFATAFDEYALKAFELNAVDYILKPFDEKRVFQTIEKLYKLIENKQQTSAVPVPLEESTVWFPSVPSSSAEIPFPSSSVNRTIFSPS